MSQRDAIAAEGQARQAAVAAGNWRPRLEKIRDQLVAGDKKQRDKAREELLAIRDPGAIGAIEFVFCRQAAELALVGVETLKYIRSADCAAALVRQAMLSPFPPVRQAAIAALGGQEKRDYVPLLLGLMQAPLQVNGPLYSPPPVRLVSVLQYSAPAPTSGGTISNPKYSQIEKYTETRFSYPRPDMPVSVVRTWVSQDPKTGRRESNSDEQSITAKRTTAIAVGPSKEEIQRENYRRMVEVTRYNNEVASRNISAGAALAQATGETRPSSPAEWWNWWNRFNEVFAAMPVIPGQLSTGGTQGELRHWDCLAPGTPVWTETGLVPVEEIAVGDRVYSCNADNGCLMLQPVLRKTTRPSAELMKILAGEEEFIASGGHLFWVSGKGWVKARELQKGMHLHAVQRTLTVEAVEAGPTLHSHSLIAADFNSFFVGKAGILTHDNTILRPTDRLVPGLPPSLAEAKDGD